MWPGRGRWGDKGRGMSPPLSPHLPCPGHKKDFIYHRKRDWYRVGRARDGSHTRDGHSVHQFAVRRGNRDFRQVFFLLYKMVSAEKRKDLFCFQNTEGNASNCPKSFRGLTNTSTDVAHTTWINLGFFLINPTVE
jgi:hypothetical protein